MADVKKHYDSLLAQHYSWICGGFEVAMRRNAALFDRLGIAPEGSGKAVDLGCGSGFQSVPLAEVGFSVTAVDLCGSLLEELRERAGALDITPVEADLVLFVRNLDTPVELVVCMGDTLTHLETEVDVRNLFDAVADMLEPRGRFMLSYRDLSTELAGVDRIIPVRSDAERVFTCFLEFGEKDVWVHDVVHTQQETGEWAVNKSRYRKLRLSGSLVRAMLEESGLHIEHEESERGLVTIVARKNGAGS